MNNVICIDSPDSLQMLRNAPDGHYRLEADIDLAGAVWEPADFSGWLDGNGKTVSNFVINRATNAGHQGFFGCIRETGHVQALKLRGAVIVEDPAATDIGAFAGVNLGTIENCTVGADAPYVPTKSGKRNIICGKCDESFIRSRRTDGVYIGAIAGRNAGTITGVLSYLELLCPPKLETQGLCGINTGTLRGRYRDVTNRTALQSAQAAAMRQQIVDHMLAQANFRWIPSKDMAFTTAYSNGTNVVYAKDVPHYGPPYTQKYGSLERAQYCLDKDDYIASWLPAYSDAGDTDPSNKATPWDVYLGNDCSGAVYWSWCRACASVSFEVTIHMVPTEENQKEFGVLPVGDYRADSNKTADVIAANTPEVIAECYAKLRKADAIVMWDPSHGHTRLVASDPMVIRDETGKIDVDASYVHTHEQGVGKDSSGRPSTWQPNARYTFRELLIDYLPITSRELRDGVPAPVQIYTKGITGPTEGSVTSNYRIISTTVTMTQTATGQTFESRLFTALVRKNIDAPVQGDSSARTTVRSVELKEHAYDLKDLPKGEYDYTVAVLLSTGKTHIVHTGHCLR